MKALSIRQPWAWLICQGIKPVENRTWWIAYRGELLIHAGKTFDHEGAQSIAEVFPDLAARMPAPDQYEMGGIVGQATLTDCVREHPSPFFTGPFGFVLADAKPLPFRPFKGVLGLFEVPDADEQAEAFPQSSQAQEGLF